MIRALVVALAAELSFLIGLLIGSIASGFGALAITAIRGWGRLSFVRALLQGTIAGLIAGGMGLWVAVTLGRSLSVPDRWLIWLAAIPPIVGEFGHFLNRFSLRHRGKPDTGIYVFLGRPHGAAWEPFRQGIFRLAIEAFKENDPEDIPVFAYQKTIWFIGRASWGLLIGAIISMWLIARVFHLSGSQ